MIELIHAPVPAEASKALSDYAAAAPGAGPNEFDTLAFLPYKKIVKACLHKIQAGLCAYCETSLQADKGQVEHIKPKGGTNAHPHLTFDYTNYAHGCISSNSKTCGQKKDSEILPIEPRPGCNSFFSISTKGDLSPVPTLSDADKHRVRETIRILGLQHPPLVLERKKMIDAVLELKAKMPALVPLFLSTREFRHILKRL
ncbi:retron system putative HNH endonuclease [Pseudomonas sp. PD9R]|uniref:retron system putative HNH endonuclease n=1 Tax=Pseudomonas sp. PD9R TaxID=2853534 RepID=UPI001C44C32A|nr:retron system putative HNH endonuclease [Pseudomonas sp. PD9R]MBV6824073.1 TIGR02646 family protein [Pseudomonas sp. PD9R]